MAPNLRNRPEGREEPQAVDPVDDPAASENESEAAGTPRDNDGLPGTMAEALAQITRLMKERADDRAALRTQKQMTDNLIRTYGLRISASSTPAGAIDTTAEAYAPPEDEHESTHKVIRLPDPAVFFNQKAKDTVKFETWFRQVKNKIDINHQGFPNDKARQAYVESRLGGDASDNLQPYLEDSHPHPVCTYAQLMAHLWEQYHDPNQQEASAAAFDSLQMKNGQDFLAFKNKFLRLAGETGLPKRDWKRVFNRKLSPDLQGVMINSYISLDVGFDTFATQAAQSALLQANIKAMQDTPKTGGRGRRGGPSRGPATPDGQTGASTPGKRRAVGSAARQHTPDKLRRLLQARLCLNCERPGHFANDCPERREPRADRINELVNQWSTRSGPRPNIEQLGTDADDSDKDDSRIEDVTGSEN